MMDFSDGRDFINLGLDKTAAKIISRLELARGGAVKVEGTWGSFARLLAAHISKQINRPILYVSPHIDDADNAADDLQTFGASVPVKTCFEKFGITADNVIKAAKQVLQSR